MDEHGNPGRGEFVPIDWVMEGADPSLSWGSPVQEAAATAFAKWADAPVVSDEDGWHPETIYGRTGRSYDGLCRIDERFRGSSAWAVRRLGGPEIATRFVKAAIRMCADKSGYVEGNVAIVDGIVFRFDYVGGSDENRRVVIYDAEVVANHPSHPPALTDFFVTLWETRAKRAWAYADVLREASRRND